MGKPKRYRHGDPLAEWLASDPVPGLPRKDMAITRQINSLLAAIGMIGLVLILARASPEATGMGLLTTVWVPPALLARRIVRSLSAQGEAMPAADRLATFLCVALFTVPPQFMLSLLFIAAGD
jgi:hypothetical protein